MPNQAKKHAKRLPEEVDVVDVVEDPHVSVPDRPSAMISLYILVLGSRVAPVEAMDFCLI
jgi:predicted CoA-binding protein|tara:strand:+ start:35 stop:214 length:180 start_codon:yes stop_codon:yes gene_type:complete